MKHPIAQLVLLFTVVCHADKDSIPCVKIDISEHNGRIEAEASPEEGLSLGSITPSEKKSGIICVANRTGRAVKLGGWRSPCECLEFDEPEWEIAAGGSSESKAVLDGSAYRGSFEKNMHISFSADRAETVNLFLPVKFAVTDEEAGGKPSDRAQGGSGDVSVSDCNGSSSSKGGGASPAVIELDATAFNPDDMGTVYIFAGRNCPGCNSMKHELAPKLLAKYDVQGGLVVLLDLEKPENMLALAELEESLGTKGTRTPVFFFRGAMFYGRAALENEIAAEKRLSTSGKISKLQNRGDRIPPSTPETGVRNGDAVRRKAKGMTLGVIAAAGLIDGVNPCVFAGLVFFASLIASSRRGGRSLLAAGAAYCLGSFICYLLLGLGLLGAISALAASGLPRTVFNTAMALVLCVLSLVSFRDAFSFKVGGGVLLKLPDSSRARMRLLMRRLTGGGMLWAGAFAAGALVTLIESACTGQVYVPVLAFLVKTDGALSAWFGYLLLYNAMFVLPLVALLFAVSHGMNAVRLASLSRFDAFAGKILMGVFFAVLATMMIIL